MNITGRVNEYELIYDVRYEINSPNEKNLSDTIILYRDYSFDENNVMGNSDREDDIQEDMISTASTLIFNKLRAVAN
jgi:LPS-assembly lipoprotein